MAAAITAANVSGMSVTIHGRIEWTGDSNPTGPQQGWIRPTWRVGLVGTTGTLIHGNQIPVSTGDAWRNLSISLPMTPHFPTLQPGRYFVELQIVNDYRHSANFKRIIS
ncbi:MAG: hypothetical protein LBC71_03460 [Oscillospiraceae bacterium]|nr:hypothetical protein [Oscillospiraceae bacterium]